MALAAVEALRPRQVVAHLGALAVAVIVLAVRPVLPVGSLRLRRVLPATIVLRRAIASSFFVTEVHLPSFLQRRYDLFPGVSGLALTAGAFTWTV